MIALDIQSKEDLIQATNEAYQAITDYIKNLNEEAFVFTPDQRWSPAGQLEHLILSSKGVASALKMPKEKLAAFGMADKPSRSYNELWTTYIGVLGTGLKAPAQFVPNSAAPVSREELLSNWNMIGDKLATRIALWSEEDLERFQLPHPAFGMLTVNEMLYSTVFHTWHHLDTMQQLFVE